MGRLGAAHAMVTAYVPRPSGMATDAAPLCLGRPTCSQLADRSRPADRRAQLGLEPCSFLAAKLRVGVCPLLSCARVRTSRAACELRNCAREYAARKAQYA